MGTQELAILINGMNEQTAKEHLLNMDYVSYPQMDGKTRKKHHRKWSKLAFPDVFKERVLKTTDLRLM